MFITPVGAGTGGVATQDGSRLIAATSNESEVDFRNAWRASTSTTEA
jgi:hypothetical protein